jgi:hypothetical protein
MKILALVSSYRKRGNTARIVQMIEGHMEAMAARQHEPQRTFYMAHHASRIKVALVWLAGTIVARFMIG